MKPTGRSAAGNVDEAARAWRRRRRFLRVGQMVMLIGAVIAVIHWLAHLEAFGPTQPPGWVDLAAGYPLAFALLLFGAIIAGKK